MKKSLFFLVLIVAMLFSTNYAGAQAPFGVNLAGAEFGSTMPGTYNIDYTYPTSDELDYYQSKGLMLIRLPIRWERIQPTLNGDLNLPELQRIKTFLDQAKTRNMSVVIDLHNYCRYKLNGTEKIIGSTEVPILAVKDLWTKLASELKVHTNIWGYGIMNEPHDMLASATWFNIAQQIINGIRSSDTLTQIIVGGDSWSSAARWMQFSDNLKNLVDPSNKLIFEAHVYFDNDASGVYDASYDVEGAYPKIGIDRVTPFINWLRVNKLKGFVGEYGVPANDIRWLAALDSFQNHLKLNCVNGTYWAGGPWWGNYILSVEPTAGVDKPQMSILTKHLAANFGCNTLSSSESVITETQLVFSPNPFVDFIQITGIENGSEIEIFDVNGRRIKLQKISNGRLEDLAELNPGIYLLKFDGKIISKLIKQ